MMAATRPLLIAPDRIVPVVISDLPTGLDPLPDSRVVSLVVDSQYFALQETDDGTLNSIEIDFGTLGHIRKEQIDSFMDNQVIPFLWNQAGQQYVLVYVLYEREEGAIQLPQQFCIGDLCWDVPGGGMVVATRYTYRLALLTRDPVQKVASRTRPLVWTAGVILAMSVLLVVAGFVLVGVFAVVTGQMTVKQFFAQFKNQVDDVTQAPGRNVQTAFMPFTLLGLGMIALAVATPMLIKAETNAQLKAGPITVGGTVGTK